ncbi:MAG: DNRLRE domain-containing protein [Candidatus Brockarchaeota archaeon]|nr:DNRLRE domain-containing protein [Candidatus Brockarchaeota archaeon]
MYEKLADTNYKDKSWIAIQSKDGENCRGFIKFDLSNIPPGSKINDARLYLYKYIPSDSPRTYRCSNVISSWSEDTVTWNNQPGVGSISSDTVISTNNNIWYSWDVASSVQKFVARDTASAIRNYGWRISDVSEGSLVVQQSFFYSKESVSSAYRPYLRVQYYPPHLDLETSGLDLAAGNWVKMTVYRKDFDNNPITRGDLNVKLDSSSTSANKKFSLTEGGAAVTELTIPNGSSSKDFWYYDDKAGTWTIHVYTNDYLYIVGGSPPFMIFEPNYGDDSEQQAVVPGPLNSFVFAAIPSPKTAGVPFTVSVTAKDAFGNTVTSYTGTNALSDTTGTINPTITGAFVNGVWSGDVVINKVASNVKISTSGGGKTGESNLFNVVAGPPAKLSITPPTFTIASGIQYSSLTITILDAHDFEATATADLAVNLATTSPDGEFRRVGTATKVTSVTIPAGSASAQVDYYDIRGGTFTLTASAAGLAPGTSAVTVIPDTTPPVTTASVGPPKHQVGTALYVGGSAAIELSATDEASGVKLTKYRVDGGSWIAYAGAFTLASYPDGSHAIGYFSSDRAGNNESEKTLTVFLDKTAPSIQVSEPEGTVIAKNTTVTFRVAVGDAGSGVATVELTLDGASQGLMEKEGDAYAKVKEVAPGAHVWSARATDNVGNSAASADAEFVLVIDTQPPTISNVLVAPSSPAWGDPVRVSATIDDALSGVREAWVYYSTDGGSTWSRIAMLAPMPPAAEYEGTIPTQMPMTRVQFYIEASDNLGNAARSSTQEFTVAIPIWLYAAGAIILVLIFAAALRARRRAPPPPPPPG